MASAASAASSSAPWSEQGLLGKALDVVAVNDLVPADNLAYLLKYDSTQGRFSGTVASEKSSPAPPRTTCSSSTATRSSASPSRKGRPRCRGSSSASSTSSNRPACSPRPRRPRGHLTAGAKKVIISAPAKGEDITDRHGRQPREVRPRQAQHHLQRQLHHELPRAGRPRPAQGRLRHRGRPDDDDPQLHRHAEDGGRPVARRTGRAAAAAAINIIPSHHRRGQGGRPGHSRSQGQADRHVLPRADADGVRGRPDRADGQGDELQGNLRRDEEGQRDLSQGHPGLHRRRGGLDRLHPRRPFEHLRRRLAASS